MRTSYLKGIVLTFLAAYIVSTEAQVDPNYEVALWYGFKNAALSYTFDDNTSNQLPVALPLFDKYDYKVSFYPVINWSPDWNNLRSAVKNGHEVGSHSVTHDNLGQITHEKFLIEELRESQTKIKSEIPEEECYTIAYPYCSTPDINILKQYYFAGRICNNQVESSSPLDYFNIGASIVGEDGSLKDANDMNSKADEALDSTGWCVYLLHGIDGDGGYSNMSSSEIEAHLEYVNGKDDEFWVGTFRNVAKYARERDSVSVSEEIVHDDSIRVFVTDNLADTIYNVPLTLRRLVPSGMDNPGIIINGRRGNSSIETIESQEYIVFDAIPDQEIYILPSDIITTVDSRKEINPLKISPNPFSDVIIKR